MHDLQGQKRPSTYLSLVTKMVVQFDEKNFKIIIINISSETEKTRRQSSFRNLPNFREIDFTKKICTSIKTTITPGGLQRPVV